MDVLITFSHMRKWSNEAELAELIKVKAKRRQRVVLTPDTALFVALKMETASKKPTTAEVAMVICDSKCETPCYLCTGKANIICRKYGHSISN
ncbi:hypothetical protein [Mesorhizobium sp. WSM2239]|uniref:Uncharacterized protein n=2 Tax=unclassified Mesorhizobium TaxID=325217 RepID=A0AAU8DEJ6_9HYPH